MKAVTRVARLAAYAACGPITGPLVAGVVRHWRTAPVLAVLYAVAIPSAWFLLTVTAAAVLPRI